MTGIVERGLRAASLGLCRWLPLFLLLAPAAGLAQAQPYQAEPEKQVHWALASFFGTGWYRVDKNRTAYIFRIPPRQILREAGWTEEGDRRIGFEIHYPVTFGLHELDEIPDFIDFENYGTLTFTPGIYVEVPVTARWSLRPYAHLGVGYERQSGEWARIGYGGIKSRYALARGEGGEWNALGALYYAGYKPDFGNRGLYGSVMGGLETHQPLPGGDGWQFNAHLTYSYLFDRLEFHVDEERLVSIRDTWELGVALGRGDGGIEIGFLRFEQVGLAVRWSSDGEYKAITLNFRSPFTD